MSLFDQIFRQPESTGRNEPDVLPLGSARLDRVRDCRTAPRVRRVQTGPPDVHQILLLSSHR